MQTLTEYLKGRSKADFAKELGVSPSQLSQYLSGLRRPGYHRILHIERITGGAVTVHSWDHPAKGVNAPAAVQPPASKQGAA